MAETTLPNGVATPSTPKPSGLSLTEYTANPSPLPTPSDQSIRPGLVPPEFLLPNGHPDVRIGELINSYAPSNSL